MKLNICIISREFYPDTAFGGIATFSQDIAVLLKEKGHQVTVISQGLHKTEVLDYHGVEVHKLRIPFGDYKFLTLFIIFYNIYISYYYLHLNFRKRFDLIDVPDHLAEGFFLSLIRQCPMVVRLHTPFSLIVDLGLNTYKKNFSYRIIKKLESLALHFSDYLYSPSRNLASLCVNFFSIKKPISYFAYPINFSSFKEEHKVNEKASLKKILFMGRLEQRKGIETVVQAFNILSKQDPLVSLTVVGNDTPNFPGYTSSLSYMKDNMHNLNRVEFIGHVPLEALPNIINAHDIVWVPSFYDNYPLVCIEAMACEKAVIVSSAGGLPELVEHAKNGFVFPVGDYKALASLTTDLVADPGLAKAFGKQAKEDVLIKFNSETIYKQTINFYELAKEEYFNKRH